MYERLLLWEFELDDWFPKSIYVKNNTKRDVSEENESMGYTFESRSSRSKRDSWNIDRRMT